MYVSKPTQLGSVFGVPCQHSHARLWCTRLKDLFTILFVSLGYSFESRPYSRAVGTEGSVVTRGLTDARAGCGNFEGLTQNRQSLVFSSSPTKTKSGSTNSCHQGEKSRISLFNGRYMFFRKIIKISLFLLKFYN